MYVRVGLVSRDRRFQSFGPALYWEPAEWWMLHFYARCYRVLPGERWRWHWGLTLWLGRHGPRIMKGSR